MIPRFSHVRPGDLGAALQAFAESDGEGTYYAGGTELLPVMKAGFAAYTTLIDLKGIEALQGISVEDGWLRIGAAVTHRQVERSPLAAAHAPALVHLVRRVANVRVRNTGTIGGNLAFAEPHSDPAAFLLACEAEVELAGPGRHRRVTIDELVIGPLMTSREPEEIIVAVHIPAAAPNSGRGYAKVAFFERPAAAVAVSLDIGAGSVRRARVATGSLTEVPMLAPGVGERLEGAPATPEGITAAAEAARGVFDAVEAVGDHNGSADFKRHLAVGLLEQAARSALQEALARA